MNMIRVTGLAVLLGPVAGCGLDNLDRLAYGTAAAIQQQNCLDSPVARKQDCLQTETYDQYQRQRGEADPPG